MSIVPSSLHTATANRMISSSTDANYYNTGGLTIDLITGYNATWTLATTQYTTRLAALTQAIERFKTDVQLKEIEADERYAFCHVWAHGVMALFIMMEQKLKNTYAPAYIGGISSGAGGVYFSTDEYMQLLDELEFRNILILPGVLELVQGIEPVISRGEEQKTRYWPPSFETLWQNDYTITNLYTYVQRMEIYALQAKSYCAKLGIKYTTFKRSMLNTKLLKPTDTHARVLGELIPMLMQSGGADGWKAATTSGAQPNSSATWYTAQNYYWKPGEQPYWWYAAVQLLQQYHANNLVGIVKKPSSPLTAIANDDIYYHRIARTGTSWTGETVGGLFVFLETHAKMLEYDTNGDLPSHEFVNAGTSYSLYLWDTQYQAMYELAFSGAWIESTNYLALKDFYSVLLGYIKIRGVRNESRRRGKSKRDN